MSGGNSTHVEEFLFPEPVSLGAIIFLAIWGFILVATTLFVLIMLYIKRNHRLIQARTPLTLGLFIISSVTSGIVFSLSLILGKPGFCQVQDAMYILVPTVVTHMNMNTPALVFASDVNDRKRDHAHVVGEMKETKVHHVFLISRLFTVPWRMLYFCIVGAFQVGLFYAVRYTLDLPGDCNRDAQVAYVINMFIFLLLLSYFMFKIGKVQDPYEMKIETNLAFVASLANLILIIIYPLAPQVFPAGFDYRWNMAIFAWVAPFINGLLPVILTNDKVMDKLHHLRGTHMREGSLKEADTKGTIFALSQGVDVFQAVINNKVLLEAFTQYTVQEWCVENILFHQAVEEFRDKFNADANAGKEYAQMIIKEYVISGAPLEINLDHSVKRSLLEELHEELRSTTFDESQKTIYKLMENDSFAKWRRTSDFKEALERVVDGRGNSSVGSSKGSQHTDLKLRIEMKNTTTSSAERNV